jgi:TonB family protein
VPKQIVRIIEEPPATPGASPVPVGTGQNSSFSVDRPTILSPNPAGYDIGPFIRDVINKLRISWYSVMPEAARKGDKGRVDLLFTIMKDGKVQDVTVIIESGNPALDSAARAAVALSQFAPLPDESKMDRIRLRVPFLYNIKPAAQ